MQALFGNAVIHVARQAKLNINSLTVNAQVDLFTTDEQLMPTLGIVLRINLPGATQAQAEEAVAAAHQGCLYSRVTCGNMEVSYWARPTRQRPQRRPRLALAAKTLLTEVGWAS